MAKNEKREEGQGSDLDSGKAVRITLRAHLIHGKKSSEILFFENYNI